MTKFIIAGVRRTGTTLIRTTLDQHPEVRCHGESFTFGGRFRHARGEKNETGYRCYLQASKLRVFRDIVHRKSVVEEYLDQLFDEPGCSAVGFKLMYNQQQRFPMVMAYLKRHDAKVIHVVRENVLKTLVSRSAKKITGRSHTTRPGGRTKVILREDRLVGDLEGIDNENRLWQGEAADMPYLRVTYDDFVANKSHELNRMLEFIGVEPITDLQSHLAKGNSDDLTEVIENYETVAKILNGTRFEWCLTR